MSEQLSPVAALVLDEAGDIEDLSAAYGAIQLFARFETREELVELTLRTLLQLFDEGLIMFFRAARDDAYNVDLAKVRTLSRDEVVQGLLDDADPSVPHDENDMLFFVETEAGRARFESLPPDSVPRVSGNVYRPWQE